MGKYRKYRKYPFRQRDSDTSMPFGDDKSSSTNNKDIRSNADLNISFAAQAVHASGSESATASGASYHRSNRNLSSPHYNRRHQHQDNHHHLGNAPASWPSFPVSGGYMGYYSVVDMNSNNNANLVTYPPFPGPQAGDNGGAGGGNHLFLEQFRYVGKQQEYQPPHCNLSNHSEFNNGLPKTPEVNANVTLADTEVDQNHKDKEDRDQDLKEKATRDFGPLIITTPIPTKSTPSKLRADAPEFVPQNTINTNSNNNQIEKEHWVRGFIQDENTNGNVNGNLNTPVRKGWYNYNYGRKDPGSVRW